MDLPRPFGRLLLLKLLARGGMGDVYLAATTGIEGAERPCVLKTVRRDHIHDASFIARFLDEARVQSQLQHPGVAQVLEAATDENGEPFTVVEYVEGRSLADLRQRATQQGLRIGWPEAVALVLELAQALAHVHERSGPDGSPLGIVHRDLSPQNVMVGFGGEVKLIDFGTARGHNRRCHTVAGVVFAKPGYVAPEIARHQVGDGRIDIYAVGVMLWELLAARRLLSGDPQIHLEQVAKGTLEIPKIATSAGAPAWLDEVIAKLTASDPDARYLSASHAVTDLAKLLAMAPSTRPSERGVRSRVAGLMRSLWPHEPARSRAEFAKLVKEAREQCGVGATPPSSSVRAIANEMARDKAMLPGTPYRLLAVIGEGQSGTVYAAEHVELGRHVALKTISAENSATETAFARFRREARVLARLSHPNLVQLYDFGKAADGRVFLAMERLHGESLEARIARMGHVPWQEAVRIAIQACDALEAAHQQALVHRDIKPANMFMTDAGQLKLVDFGVATAVASVDPDANERRPKAFVVFGTPEYMAPEQVANDPVDARTDIYALGCSLYEMLTGERVFDGGSSVEIMGKQLRDVPPSPRERAPHARIPQALNAIVMRALSKRREARFDSADDFRLALEDVLASPERKRTRARTVAQVVLMIGAAVGIAVASTRMAERRAAPATTTAVREERTFANDSAESRGAPQPSPAIDPVPIVLGEPSAPPPDGRRVRTDPQKLPSLSRSAPADAPPASAVVPAHGKVHAPRPTKKELRDRAVLFEDPRHDKLTKESPRSHKARELPKR
jgi:serine/threonine protein kinase